MTRALNIKIQDAIYSQLDQHAREHNVTKTQIVEMALSQWFSGNVDEDVDNSVDDVDEDVEANRVHVHDSEQTDIEGLIQARIAEYLLGVSCPVPEDSNRSDQDDLPQETNVDDDVDNVDGSVETNLDGNLDNSVDGNVDGNVDNVDVTYMSHPKIKDEKINLPPYTQSELAKRLGIGASTLHKARSRADFSEWSKARDPQGITWEYRDKKYHPK